MKQGIADIKIIKEILEKSTANAIAFGTGINLSTVKKLKSGERAEEKLNLADAIKITEENAKRNNVSINCIQNNLLDNLENNFDIIISNPPYISKKDMASLQEEVKHDPQLALDGGNDGTDIIRRIIFDKSIKKNTILMLELGYDQAELVSNLMEPFYNNIEIIKDYCGISRFINEEKGV